MKTIEIPTSRAELSETLKRMSFNEIEDRLWQLYGIIGAVAGTHTAEAEVGKITVTNKLPERSSDISLMKLEELYDALAETNNMDPTRGYDTSTYFVYAINDNAGTDDSALSNVDNLEAVGAEWYRQLNRPTATDMHWVVGDHKIFGGPLSDIARQRLGGTYSFYWYHSLKSVGSSQDSCYWSCVGSSHDICYWSTFITGDVYVAVVHR